MKTVPRARVAVFCREVRHDRKGRPSAISITQAVELTGIADHIKTNFLLIVECEPGTHTLDLRFMNPRDEPGAAPRTWSVAATSVAEAHVPMLLLLPYVGRYRMEVLFDGELIEDVPLEAFVPLPSPGRSSNRARSARRG